MANGYNVALLIGGGLSLLAALAHIGVILVGPSWYRLFGAGERMAVAAQEGRWFPAIITLAIALVLASWGAYALSGAGVIGPLPLLRPALCVITLIYLVRALLGPFALIGTGRSTRFIIVSSVICLLYGVVHLLGLVRGWDALA
ncbi:hypothetical protein ACW9IB_12590 [Pseudomonas sp. SDO524_S393]